MRQQNFNEHHLLLTWKKRRQFKTGFKIYYSSIFIVFWLNFYECWWWQLWNLKVLCVKMIKNSKASVTPHIKVTRNND